MEIINKNKDYLLEKLLKHVAFDGWTDYSIKKAAQDLGWQPEYAYLLFPNGIYDIIDHFILHIDSNMITALNNFELSNMRTATKIYTVIKVRLEQSLHYRPALARMVAFHSLPYNSLKALQNLWRTVDNIWFLCNDQATDFNYYTKRTLLAGVYSSTLLHWLNDYSENQVETWDFLVRRIDNALKIGTIKFTIQSKIKNIPFLRLLKKPHIIKNALKP